MLVYVCNTKTYKYYHWKLENKIRRCYSRGTKAYWQLWNSSKGRRSYCTVPHTLVLNNMGVNVSKTHEYRILNFEFKGLCADESYRSRPVYYEGSQQSEKYKGWHTQVGWITYVVYRILGYILRFSPASRSYL